MVFWATIRRKSESCKSTWTIKLWWYSSLVIWKNRFFCIFLRAYTLRKLKNFIDFRFLHVCVQSTSDFVSKISEMSEKIIVDVDRLLLIPKVKKSSILAKYIRKFFPMLLKPKEVYLRPFLSSLSILKICKQNFMYFWHKHIEIKPNFSYRGGSGNPGHSWHWINCTLCENKLTFFSFRIVPKCNFKDMDSYLSSA